MSSTAYGHMGTERAMEILNAADGYVDWNDHFRKLHMLWAINPISRCMCNRNACNMFIKKHVLKCP